MAVDTGHNFGSYTTPNLTDSPFMTPSRETSRRSSRHGSFSPNPSSSPPMLSGDHYLNEEKGKDLSNDESISILDPRRFTPTLHASLVSEILSLRREIESKNNLVLSLEENLQGVNDENTRMNETLSSNATDTRSMKRQMQQLEHGTLSALEQLAKERDAARETLADTRKRFEETQKKLRSHEQDMNRTHTLWDRDRQNWDNERRNLDLKVHVVEGRLKTVLEEIAAAQAIGDQQFGADSDVEEIRKSRGLGRGSDTVSNRSTSVQDHHRDSGRNFDGNGAQTGRFSAMSGLNALASSKVGGMSLAEELELDEAEDEVNMDDSDYEDVASPDALPEESFFKPRPFSCQSHLQYPKARRVLGLTAEENEGVIQKDAVNATGNKEVALNGDGLQESNETPCQFTDTATQFSPPTSPILQAREGDKFIDKHEDDRYAAGEAAGDLSRHTNSLLVEQTSNESSTPVAVSMVSQACQTIEPPPSPPLTPNTLNTIKSAATFGDVNMKTIATQTSLTDMSSLFSPVVTRGEPLAMDIPTITIHPPLSGSASVRTGVVLPPHTKNASSQASIEIPISLRSISVQTEEIRVDTRPIKLPPHLLPSSISSQPPSPSLETPGTRPSGVHEPPLHNIPQPKRKPPPVPEAPVRDESKTTETQDAYPGNNDNGPLNNDNASELRRPIRSESLFAGFDVVDDEQNDVLAENEYSDDDFGNGEPIRKTLSKVQNAWKLVPQSPTEALSDRFDSNKQDAGVGEDGVESQNRRAGRGKISSRTEPVPKGSRSKKPEKPQKPLIMGKQQDIRRTALITSGTVAHSQRSRSPSAPNLSNASATVPPPFPVPTRMSSRRLPVSVSEGARSPTPNSTSFFGGHRNRDHARPPPKTPVLRKVRSAAAVPKATSSYRQRSRSPPSMSPSSVALESPQLPPLPRNELTSRYSHVNQPVKNHSQASSTPSQAVRSSNETAGQQSSVVDAIAQTMIGEWMWKYVRKRKSFGMAESPQLEFETGRNGGDNASSSGIRHKRWVWLAPYERAVMWSSKQPTSGPALLGKSGRKLLIQSVLDVKDDTPMPKNASPKSLFGRSILILTPQRALKFTATTRERHYVWLTALSFLSNSTLGVNDKAILPVVPPQEYRPPSSQRPSSSLRRNPIRDSIRVAKSKARPTIHGGHAYTTPVGALQREAIRENDTFFNNTYDEGEEEAAEPPQIPRLAAHTRKRSNTGPRPAPPMSFRSFPAPNVPSSHSLKMAAPSDSHPLSFPGGGQISTNRHMSDNPNIPPNNATNNFFDAVGTVRMEAFVDRTHGSGEGRGGNGYVSADQGVSHQQAGKKPVRNSYRTRHGRKKDMIYWGFDSSVGGGREGKITGVGEDPFEGF